MYRLLFLSVVLCGCSTKPSTGPVPRPDAAVFVECPVAAEMCESLSCEDLVGRRCGVQESCGATMDCGPCPSPYSCGTLDLQLYQLNPTRCGLGCRKVQVSSWNCDALAPVEYACQDTEELTEFANSERFDYRYSCYGLGILRGGERHFCCGI